MREVALTVAPDAVERVLDRILPVAPHGVHEVRVGDQVELRIRAARLPPGADLAKRGGRAVKRFAEREVPDDWRLVRRLDLQPVRAGRVAIRYDWMEPTDADVDVVLADPDAFGLGTHPTTQLCLAILGDLEPQGAFADLGCGTGVLAAAAAALGWEPVLAIDANPRAVETAHATAAATGVEVSALLGDLGSVPLPAVAGAVANVPPQLHALLAARVGTPPDQLIVSGVLAEAMDATIAAYRMSVAERRDAGGWAAARLTSGCRRRMRPASVSV